MMLSEPQSVLPIWLIIAGVVLMLAYLGFDLRAAFRSDDEREHAAAASTIGQLLTAGLALAGLVTAAGIWRGHVGLAVIAACALWLLAVASSRFAHGCRLRQAART